MTKEVISFLKELIIVGMDKYEQYVQDNPRKVAHILKAHNQLFLEEILQEELFEISFEIKDE